MQPSNAYDSMGNLVTQSGSGGSAPTATRTYTYDLDGQLLTASTGAAGTPTAAGYQPATSESFGYDDRGRLLSTSGSAGTSTFSYNGSGQVSLGDGRGGHHRLHLRLGRAAGHHVRPDDGNPASYTYNSLEPGHEDRLRHRR